MFNVTVKFDNAEDAAYLTHLVEKSVFKGRLATLDQAILADTVKKAKGVSCQRPNGVTMTADEIKKARDC